MSRVQVLIDAGFSVRQAHGITGTNAATVTAAGSDQAGATLIAADNNLVTTATANQGVVLPSFAAGDIVIANGTAVNVLVYPASGAQLNNGTANVAITLRPGMAVLCKAISATAVLVFFSNASVGLGTYQEATRALGSAVALTTDVLADIVTISLAAGDWDVEGQLFLSNAGTTVVTQARAALNTTSVTLPSAPQMAYAIYSADASTGKSIALPTGTRRFSLAATTTVYLITGVTFTTSTSAGYGIIRARQII